MTSNERKGVYNAASDKGLRQSSYDANKQTDGNNVVKHIGDNRTMINGKTYYGSSDPKKALGNL